MDEYIASFDRAEQHKVEIAYRIIGGQWKRKIVSATRVEKELEKLDQRGDVAEVQTRDVEQSR